VANGIQYLPTYRSGFTGPSERIGGSSPYHIDLKILQTLPLQERIRAMDSLANQYKSIGREIEFSNQAVSGRRWNPTAPLEEKVNLLEAAAKAHAPRSGWGSYDFYVPFAGNSRFDPGAVEGASIYIPGVVGGKIRRASAGDYGFYSEALDPSGKVVFRVGHGDISRPETEAEILVAQQAAQQTQTGQTQDKSAEDLLNEAIAKALQPAPPELKSSYTGPSEDEFRRRRNQLESTMLELMLDQASRQQEQPAAPRLGQNMSSAQAAAMGLRSFGQIPKSTI
jgi:hypothetical protein